MPYAPFYDVYSTSYLATFFIFALLETLLCSGITYGWACIVIVFKEERFYMDLCQSFYRNQNKTNEILAINLNLPTSVGGGAEYFSDGILPGCPMQDTRLNLIFTVSLFCLCGIKFPAGVFIDTWGPRIARAVGGTMYIIACVGLGFVTIGYENFLFPIFALICMGGSLLVVAVYQVANIIYRKSRSRNICILHGAFDSSAVVLLIFKVMYEKGISLHEIMLGYSTLCLSLILVGTVFLVPPLQVLLQWIEEENEINQNYSHGFLTMAGPDFAVSSLQGSLDYLAVTHRMKGYEACGRDICIDEVRNGKSVANAKKKQKAIGESEVEISNDYLDNAEIHEESDDDEETSLLRTSRFKRGSVLQSIFSPLYLFELIFLLTFQLKLWYFVGSLADFLERLSLNDRKTAFKKFILVSEYINLFGYIQFGGILVTPIIGFVFDKSRLSSTKQDLLTTRERRVQHLRECITPFLITSLLGLLFCVLSMIEDITFQVPSFILYTTVRGFLYANHGAFVGAAFPASQFGTLYGLGIFIGGTFGILQYALFELTSGPLHGDPLWTNTILLILVAIGNLHPFYLWWYVRSEKKRIESKRIIATQRFK